MDSPYDGLEPDKWLSKTQELVAHYPLQAQEFYDIVLHVWSDIFSSGLGSKPFRIGIDIFPKPQIMGYFLHELIPLELSYRYPTLWRGEQSKQDKDIVYLPDDTFSIEIKTSSSPKSIFGNRSYAQEANAQKRKSGYYLAINFEKFNVAKSQPRITLVRFGWLDHHDWLGQHAASGQQARLSPLAEQRKLLKLPLTKE